MSRFLWTQKQDVGPSARFGHAMAYDAARQQTLLFGGADSTGLALRDTWGWDGEFWTQLSDIGPAARSEHGLCFDLADNVAFLFGGASGSYFGDSWQWNGQDWTQVEDSGPSARYGHGLVWDSSRSRAVLFGGENAAAQLLGDTWEWDGQSWTQVEDTGPSARVYAAMAFDPVQKRTIVFGGHGNAGELADTWTWDGSKWTQVQDIGPSACLRSAMASSDAASLMYGGLSSAATNPPPQIFGASWVYSGGHWTERQDIGPGARWGHALAYDSARRTFVFFGGATGIVGSGGALRDDTWEHAETDPPAQTGSGGNTGNSGTPQIVLSPSSAQAGQQVTVQLIVAPSNAAASFEVAWIRDSRWQAIMNGASPQANDFNLIGAVSIPPQATSATVTFTVPAVGEAIVVVAADSQSIVASADLPA